MYKRQPGVDGIRIDAFAKRYRPEWKRIHAQLLDGTYRPQPALRVEIPKEAGGMRLLGIPCVLDRIMQSIAKVLGLYFNPIFSDYSYGYLPGRSVGCRNLPILAYIQVPGFWITSYLRDALEPNDNSN